MKVVIWVLLVIAILAVVWEYYSPAVPETELIATVSDTIDPSSTLGEDGNEVDQQPVENPELPEAPTGPVINSDEVSDSPDAIDQNAVSYKLITDKKITWIGRRVGGGQQGSVTIASGDIYVIDGERIAGGTLYIDMTTIRADSNNATLNEQLQSAEYFNTDEYPTAKFEFIEYTDRQITGLLTIKNITKQITFPASLTVEDDIVIGESRFVLDRTEWDIRGGLPAVSEYMELSFELIRQPLNR